MNRALLFVAVLCFHATSTFAQTRNGWRSDYAGARAEAKKSGKPIFLVIRCEPCEDSRGFDERVLRAVPEIAEKFIPVRLTRITGIDLNVFEFDYDLTWAAFFLNADETIYGRYGGRDADGPDGRLSLPGLRYAMQQAEIAHQNPPKPPLPHKAVRAEDLPGGKASRGCIHCHNVNEFHRAELKAQGLWKREAYWVYPLPENIGLTLEVDRGNRVAKVEERLSAAKAGIEVGAVIRQVNGYPIASFADFQFALHKAPSNGAIAVRWMQNGKEHSATIELPEGWRKTNLSWRPSLVEVLPSLPISGGDLSIEEKTKLGLKENQLAIRQDKFVHSTLRKIGLQNADVLIGLNGRMLEGGMKDLAAQIRANYLVGDKVTLEILRGGKPMSLEAALK